MRAEVEARLERDAAADVAIDERSGRDVSRVVAKAPDADEVRDVAALPTVRGAVVDFRARFGFVRLARAEIIEHEQVAAQVRVDEHLGFHEMAPPQRERGRECEDRRRDAHVVAEAVVFVFVRERDELITRAGAQVLMRVQAHHHRGVEQTQTRGRFPEGSRSRAGGGDGRDAFEVKAHAIDALGELDRRAGHDARDRSVPEAHVRAGDDRAEHAEIGRRVRARGRGRGAHERERERCRCKPHASPSQ